MLLSEAKGFTTTTTRADSDAQDMALWLFSHFSKRHLVLAFTGFFMGQAFMSFLTSFERIDDSFTSSKTRLQFIPRSPHSHGETDDFAAPDQEQLWSNDELGHHHGNILTVIAMN